MKQFTGKIAILGSGNIGLSLAKGLVKAGYAKPEQLILTRRNIANLAEFAALGYGVDADNAAAVAASDIVVLAVLPQQLNQLMEQIKPATVPAKQVFISVASGVSCADIRSKSYPELEVIRAMPNTAIAIGQSMTCVATDNAAAEHVEEVCRMFETVGAVVKINEDLMTAATALCACGTAFFLRAIRAASQGGVEIGFHADEALKMAVQTAKGAADLLLQMKSHPEQEIDKVTSPKGCTIAGLNEMEHNGFSSSLIKGIKLSALKAGALYTKE
ncbi:pyrroline-5-carboxylate reductase [Pedobacter antarcticus 4BY]|uniref:Pyrroline-5-carboxylate reductase n=2 Tax=Pedobacter antarcticus TaxID=34086 RepID=A0A081PGI6_9SPHI|nr:pyrroline-5-carboxylate reductase [Pedobacter antarcticus]KEQ29809.1 pyrroline-5-carboxylate reductase [Pedobacter antarcticus 4BY]SFE67623.1 pyrroline-5-carboxylate reductase [Pedobacter antarcticus]